LKIEFTLEELEALYYHYDVGISCNSLDIRVLDKLQEYIWKVKTLQECEDRRKRRLNKTTPSGGHEREVK